MNAKNKSSHIKALVLLFSIVFLIITGANCLAADWTDSNWSEGGYEQAQGVAWDDVGNSLILGSDPAHMIFNKSILNMGQQSKIPNLYGMAVYQDKLYIAGCISPLEAMYGDVVVTDGTDYTHSYCFTNECGVLRINVLKDKFGKEYLVCPGIEEEYGTSDTYGYVFDGTAWKNKLEDLPFGSYIHSWELYYYKGKVYVASAWSTYTDMFSTANDFLGTNFPNTPGQTGITWNYNTGSRDGELFQKFIEYKGYMYITCWTAKSNSMKPRLYKFDGNYTTVVSDNFYNRMWAATIYSKDSLLYIGDGNSIKKTDGATVFPVTSTGRQVWDLKEHKGDLNAQNGKFYASLFGDSANKAQVWVLNELTNSFEKLCQVNENYGMALADYRGRLWWSTGPGDGVTSSGGNVYVSAYQLTGNLIPAAHDMGEATDFGTISWAGSNNTIKFQIRTSDTQVGLADEQFVGPLGTALDFYETSATAIFSGHDGDRWIQYKAYLSTANNSTTPSLSSVTITGEKITSNVQVGRYDIWELTVTNDNVYSNPFNFEEIQLNANLISPSGETIDCYGFYDGDGNGGQSGNVWKLRFMPDETGIWNYTYTWSGTGTKPASGSGIFECLASANKGALKLDPNYDHHIAYANNEHFFWNGDTEWFFLSDAYSQANRLTAIDFLAGKKVNNLLMGMINGGKASDNSDDYPVYPWPSTTDKTHFNLLKMRTWEEVIEYMKQKNVFADLWFYLDDSVWLIPAAGSAEEYLYFKYMIARFAAFSNVTWNLALEYNEYRSDSWVNTMAAYVKDKDPSDHLLSVHQLPSETYNFSGNTNLDHTSLQRLGANDSTLNSAIINNRNATYNSGFPIPICHEEFFIEGSSGDLTQFRKGIWAITAGGGYYKAASLGWWIGTSYQNGQHFNIAKYLYDFVTTDIEWWKLIPNNSLVNTNVYCSYESGEQYLAYRPSTDAGNIIINLGGTSNTFSVKKFNPQTGQTTDAGTVTGGGSQTFTPPSGAQDWALYLKKTQSQGPQAQFSATPLAGNAPLEVTFTDSSTGNIDTWNWVFGDGNTSNEQSPVYTYNNADTYTVSLTVTANDGQSDTETKTDYITVSTEETPPAIAITEPEEGDYFNSSPIEVNGTASDSSGIKSVTVNGEPASTTNGYATWTAQVPLNNQGSNQITAEAIDNNENKNQDSINVNFDNQPPSANAGEDKTTEEDQEVTFTGSATDNSNGEITYSWDFDSSDGIQQDATGQQVTHTYADPGLYTVTLTVTDEAQNSGTDTAQVMVSSKDPSNHPRIWITPAYLKVLATRANSNNSKWIDFMNTAASDLRYINYIISLGLSPSGDIIRIEQLALAYAVLNELGLPYMSNGTAYYANDFKDAAIAVIKYELTLSPKESKIAMFAIAYDWLYSELDGEYYGENTPIKQAMTEYINAASKILIDQFNNKGGNIWYYPASNWAETDGFNLTLGGLAVKGEDDYAAEIIKLMDYWVGQKLLALNVIGESYLDGTIYNYSERTVALAALALFTSGHTNMFTETDWFRNRLSFESMTDRPGIAIKDKREYKGYFDNGDAERDRDLMTCYGWITRRVLTHYYSDKQEARDDALRLQWWLDQRPSKITYALYAEEFLFYDPELSKAAENLNPSKVTQNANGMIAMRSNWLSADGVTHDYNSTHLIFTAMDYYTSHQHVDVGNFTIYSHGEDMLIENGSYDGEQSMGEQSHEGNYYARTIAHNCPIIYNPTEIFRRAWDNAQFSMDGGQRLYLTWNRDHTFDNKPDGSAGAYYFYGPDGEPGTRKAGALCNTADILAYEDKPEVEDMQNNPGTPAKGYTYISSDLTNGYYNLAFCQKYDGDTDYDDDGDSDGPKYSDYTSGNPPKVDLVTRQYVYLRPDYVVVFDRTNSLKDASGNPYLKKWLLHFKTEPDISGKDMTKEEISWGETLYHNADSVVVTGKEGKGKLFIKNLMGLNIRKIGRSITGKIEAMEVKDGQTTITDTTKNWTDKDELVGIWFGVNGVYTSWIHAKVVSYTANTITVDKDIVGTGQYYNAAVGNPYELGKAHWVYSHPLPALKDGCNFEASPTRHEIEKVYGSWRIEIEPTTLQQFDTSLVVCYPTGVETMSMPATSLIKSDNNNMQGALVEDVKDPRIVLFSTNASDISDVTYAVSYTEQSTALLSTEHLLTNMIEGEYEIEKGGQRILSAQTFTASDQGTLTFKYQGSGTYHVKRAGVPNIKITDPDNGDIISTPTITVSGTSFDEDGVDSITIYVNDELKTTLEGAESWSAQIDLGSDGQKQIKAEAIDTQGNTASDIVTVTLDTTAPVISELGASGITNSTAKITWKTDNDPSTSQVEYYKDGDEDNHKFSPKDSSYNQNHTVNISGLELGTTYYYSAISEDEATNKAQSGYQTFTTDGKDSTPPADTTDLVATSDNTTTIITLTWTAPGDDGTQGTAASYDVRYSSTEIKNDKDWEDATELDNEPTPQEAGSQETFSFEGPKGAYYFALKTTDDFGNESNISNNAYVENLCAPIITSFTISPETAKAKTQIDFTFTADDKDGVIIKCEIDFQGGEVYDWVNTTNAAVISGAASYKYQLPSGYTPTLKVTDDDGLCATYTGNLIIEQVASMQMALTANPITATAPCSIDFMIQTTPQDSGVIYYLVDIDADNQIDFKTKANEFSYEYLSKGVRQVTAWAKTKEGYSVASTIVAIEGKDYGLEVDVKDSGTDKEKIKFKLKENSEFEAQFLEWDPENHIKIYKKEHERFFSPGTHKIKLKAYNGQIIADADATIRIKKDTSKNSANFSVTASNGADNTAPAEIVYTNGLGGSNVILDCNGNGVYDYILEPGQTHAVTYDEANNYAISATAYTEEGAMVQETIQIDLTNEEANISFLPVKATISGNATTLAITTNLADISDDNTTFFISPFAEDAW
ncbi:MAG: PKD domain-containing protein, partial [Candidatus Omnitrophota bacterium]